MNRCFDLALYSERQDQKLQSHHKKIFSEEYLDIESYIYLLHYGLVIFISSKYLLKVFCVGHWGLL